MPRDFCLRIGVPFFLLIVLMELAAILILNAGHFAYTLDDPYIHLALADHIARGHYGINPPEASAPSSSILWPFLLAPFMRAPFGEYVPLAINIAAGWLTVRTLAALLDQAFPESGAAERNKRVMKAMLMVLLVAGTNVVGLIFTGMEHSLQLLATVVLLHGALCLAAGGRPHSGFYAAVVLGPLIRYENLALSGAAIAFLFLLGRRKSPLALAAAVTAPIIGFSCYLHSLGLGLLPTSVLAKSSLVASGGTAAQLVGNLSRNLNNPMGSMEAMGMVALGSIALLSESASRERRWAGCAALAAALHLAAGQFGWLNRYEISSYVFVMMTLLWMARRFIADHIGRKGLLPISAGLAMGVLLLGHSYITGLFLVPLASNNIHEQQFQMRRFAFEFFKRPVAVMDLGLVSYRNPNYVLDLCGLASREALEHTRGREPPAWMDELARRKSVTWAMMYEHPDLGVPGNWKKLGVLHLGKRKISPYLSTVSFYAVDDSSYSRMRALIPAFRKSLPKGVVFADHPGMVAAQSPSPGE